MQPHELFLGLRTVLGGCLLETQWQEQATLLIPVLSGNPDEKNNDKLPRRLLGAWLPGSRYKAAAEEGM